MIAGRCWRARGAGAARGAGWREAGGADTDGRAGGSGVGGVGRGAANSAEHDWLDSRAFTTALAIGLLAFGLHLVVDFHLKIPALAMAVATAAGLAVGRAWTMEAGAAQERGGWGEEGQTREESGRAEREMVGPAARAPRTALVLRRAGSGLVTAVVLVGGVFWVLPHYQAEAERRPARETLDGLARKPVSVAERGVITRAAREAFSRAVEIDPANSQAWADRAYTAAILGHDEPARAKELGVGAEGDARRALEHGAVVPEFWLRLGVALDMQGRWEEAGYAFSEALGLAPSNATTWFYFAYHLSLNKVALPRARAAVATSLRLDPSLPEADTLRQHLAAHR